MIRNSISANSIFVFNDLFFFPISHIYNIIGGKYYKIVLSIICSFAWDGCS